MTRKTPFERDFSDLYGSDPEVIDVEVAAPRRHFMRGNGIPSGRRARPDWKTFVIGLPVLCLLGAVMIPLAYVAVMAFSALVYLVGSFWHTVFS